MDSGEEAGGFVTRMRKQNQLIMGIGHKIRTLQNPDMRVKIIKDYAKEHFPKVNGDTPYNPYNPYNPPYITPI